MGFFVVKVHLYRKRERMSMRPLRAVSTLGILILLGVSPAEATTPTNSIVKLMVTASAGNMPMSVNTKMTTAMSGSASATFVVNKVANTLCYLISSKGLQNITEAHVQVTSTEKDVLVFNPKNINSPRSTCLTVARTSLVDIAAHPGKYSFMIHTKTSPDGAVMGNLRMSR